MNDKSKENKKVEAEIFFKHTKILSKEQMKVTFIFKAYNFATKVHANQTRKGKSIPYIFHPLSVANRLSRVGAKESIIAAGILHDTIEDSKEPNKISREDIEREFGGSIARMVDDVTEQDRSLPWAERKRAALAHVPDMKHDSLLIKSADVLDNLSDQIEDYKVLGDKMFENFNASKKQQLERYEKLTVALEKAWAKNPLLPSLKEVVAQVTRLWT